MLNGENIDTYYVYDDYNNLTYVLPHLAAQQLQSANQSWSSDDKYIRLYGYYYEYNGRGQCTLKRLPGTESIRMVYDALGNVVFSQDGVQRSKNEWSYQLYDGQQRPTVSGRFTYGATPESVCKILSEYTGEGTLCGYTTTLDFGKYSGVIVDKVLYYDSYDFIRIMTDYEKSALMYVNAEQPYTEAFKVDGKFKVAGMQTGAVSYVFDQKTRSVSAAYYDIHGRNVQTRSTNFKGGAETVLTAYTFSGKERYKKIVTNINGSNLITQQYEYHYDHAERPTETYLTVNGGAKQLLTKLCYDEVGRLATRTHGNNVTERYDYNIRSWVTDINSTAFKEHLRYEQSGETPGCYGGNIASMIWKVNAGAYSSQGAFHNSYDKLSRLCAVKYQDSHNEYLKFANYSYDALGNILNLQRQGMLDDGSIGDIDNLTYSYDGNQLVKVDDSAEAPTYSGAMHFADKVDEDEEYRYDANGNMTADLNNHIVSVSYNSLNLPSNITYANGSHIDYTYSSAGEKVCTDYYNRVKVNIVRPTITATGRYLTYYKHTNTEYCGNHIFENGELKMTLFAGGYVTYSNGEPEYHFYVRDHQGNNRLVMSEDGMVEQVNDYTPFGVQMKNSFAETSDQRYKYNGKELDRMLGLDLYDYGARFYDARIARWQTIDPLCEKYYSISPYAYCANNPILFIDPDGRAINLLGMAIGGLIGGAINSGIELVSQLSQNGTVTSSRAIGRAAVQGAIVGATAVATCGASLATTVCASGVANAVGGTANRAIQGESTTISDIITDVTIGSVSGVLGAAAGDVTKKGLDAATPAVKGRIGETTTRVKYAIKGYKSERIVKVKTGLNTPTGRSQKAYYDFGMEQIVTHKKIIVESKYNSSTLTPNQKRALPYVTIPFKVDRTTSTQFQYMVVPIVTESASGGSSAVSRKHKK
jgi:RHS repeat-associated protein